VWRFYFVSSRVVKLFFDTFPVPLDDGETDLQSVCPGIGTHKLESVFSRPGLWVPCVLLRPSIAVSRFKVQLRNTGHFHRASRRAFW
jgi:hypothetical protein